MPNKRADGLVPINFRASPELLRALEEGRSRFRAMDRSQFIRDAIKDKLISMGIQIKDGVELAPDRMGKGGVRRSVLYDVSDPANVLNDDDRKKGSGK